MSSVTILVSVKNKEATIGECLRSLVETDYPDKKILCIDNMSTDNSFAILRKFEDQVELHQVAGGLSRVFNWALDRIDTDYVAFTDADCVVDRDWLKELLRPFEEEPDIIATAGYCGTPEGLSPLQTMIGLELEDRFKKFPRYLSRAPTMNLCVKTEVARRVKFDEQQMVAVEVDFGYRLTSLGKMLYTPKARVLHYHRGTWRSYFHQQKEQVKWNCRVLLKHGRKALGDHISTPMMIIQIPLFMVGAGFLLLSGIERWFLIPAAVLLVILVGIYLKNASELVPFGRQYIRLLGMFTFRTFAWTVGVIEAVVHFSREFALHLLRRHAVDRRGG